MQNMLFYVEIVVHVLKKLIFLLPALLFMVHGASKKWVIDQRLFMSLYDVINGQWFLDAFYI